jgi:hypothetical protein
MSRTKTGTTSETRVQAFAVPRGGSRVDRLIRNWYYTTDEPFSENVHLWSSGGASSIEHGLAGVRLYQFEDLFIVLTITSADPELDKGNPRLTLVGEHDYAVFEHLPFLRAVRDGGLVIAVVCLVGLVFLAWNGGEA